MVCPCGKDIYARGMCPACYKRDYYVRFPEKAAIRRDKQKEAARLRWQDPEKRERLLEASRKHDAKRKHKKSALFKDWMARNPEKREEYYANRRAKLAALSDDDKQRRRDDVRAIPPKQVEALRDLQGGACAICRVQLDTNRRRSREGEQADHCHATGNPRGLLCMICNRALGFYETWQRPNGLRIQPYEDYLANPPASQL